MICLLERSRGEPAAAPAAWPVRSPGRSRLTPLRDLAACCAAGFQFGLCRLRVIHVIPAIPTSPVRPKSGHPADARVYEGTAYGAAEIKSLEIETSPPAPGAALFRDSTLAACYPSLYAPHAGGAYDSHHRTAGVAGRARRRGSGVATRRADATS